MNIAKCRGLPAFFRLNSPRNQPLLGPAVRAISSSHAVFKTKNRTESLDFESLPRTKLHPDGVPIKPLEPWEEYRKAHQAPSPDVAKNEEVFYRDAVASGDIPDTALAKQVYLNWKRFPGCIVLTRVGKFYEVCPLKVSSSSVLTDQSYFASAVRLSSLLNLKLANRRYSGGTWPFSGFPVTHLDKYLKILVQDLGQTVVLVEELEQDENAVKTDLIPRKVGRVVTPGTLLDESWLNGNESRYLLALAIDARSTAGSEGKLPISPASSRYPSCY